VKINFALYFPVDTANIGSDRRSLYDVLTKAVKKVKSRKFIQTAILIQRNHIKIFSHH
jgi:hypothetical protein